MAGAPSLPAGPVHEGFSHCSLSIAASSCYQSQPQTPQEVRPQMNGTGVGCPLQGDSVLQEALWPCFLPHRLLPHVPPWCPFFRQLTTSLHGCRLPWTVASSYCHARSAASTRTQTFTATATTQPWATCEQLQLPSARPYTVRVLCPVMPHSDSWPHTSLSLSACLLRHLRILKGELVFKKVFFHFKNREIYCNDGS